MFSDRVYDPRDFRGRRALVMGLGRFGGGVAAARFLCLRGARVLATDVKPAEALEGSLRALRGLPIAYRLGEHRPEDFAGADLVVASPAVPRDHPLLRIAAEAGAALETEMNLFLKHCAGRVLAVTGSNGKSTTTALLGQIAACGMPRVRVGGNIGRSLLCDVEEIGPADLVVIEISSFQLEDLPPGRAPWIVGVVTSLSPNHVRRHGSVEAYYGAKRRILEAGPPPNAAALDPEDPVAAGWIPGSPRRVIAFGSRRASHPSVWIDGDRVLQDVRGPARPLFRREDLPLPGDFNLRNACAAAAAALAAGIGPEAIREGIRAFRSLPHRLEAVGTAAGVPFYNDSVATTPESAILGLRALSPGVVLIAGGSDKGISFEDLGRAIARRARGVVLIGATAGAIEEAVARAQREDPEAGRRRDRLQIAREGSLEGAIERAWEMARPDGRVLLSPACASFDMFPNFAERGERFRRAVEALAAGVGV